MSIIPRTNTSNVSMILCVTFVLKILKWLNYEISQSHLALAKCKSSQLNNSSYSGVSATLYKFPSHSAHLSSCSVVLVPFALFKYLCNLLSIRVDFLRSSLGQSALVLQVIAMDRLHCKICATCTYYLYCLHILLHNTLRPRNDLLPGKADCKSSDKRK